MATGVIVATGIIGVDRYLSGERAMELTMEGDPPAPGAATTADVPAPSATRSRMSPRPAPATSGPSHRALRRPVKTPTPPAPRPRQRTPKPSMSSTAAETEAAVVHLTNIERAGSGCAPLRVDSRLRTAARRHSADMAEHDYFSHTSRDDSTPWERMRRAGYQQPGAENIARGYSTPAAVMKGWMSSPGHRANILNCALKAIGVGVHLGSGGPWWTQDFGWT